MSFKSKFQKCFLKIHKTFKTTVSCDFGLQEMPSYRKNILVQCTFIHHHFLVLNNDQVQEHSTSVVPSPVNWLAAHRADLTLAETAICSSFMTECPSFH